jgi:hypothetical protein
MERFTQRQIAEVKELLSQCTDEDLYEIFSPVFDVIKEKLVQRRKRPPAEYSNSSPYGIADEVHRN